MRWTPKPAFDPYSPHIWFAWYPVTMPHGLERVWLEKVWRIKVAGYGADAVYYADSLHRLLQEAL